MTTPLAEAAALPAPLARALSERGYDQLTDVQGVVLSPDHAGHDLLVSAQTGSGKTVAFGLAMAADLLGADGHFAPPDTPRALIIAPTRELALQVRRELEWLYAATGAAIASCVGGMDARTERRALERGSHIVVGTPGRLRDHLERGSLDLGSLRVAVLDEADEMLDLGFREDLEFILEAAPADRRTLMFSATVSPGIERLAQNYQRDALRLSTEERHVQHGDIMYRALTVANEDAENAIVNVLRLYEARNALVFCKTRAMVNHLTARLLNRGFAVVPLSGELAQDERARALQAMRDGRARVCVATDVAARGIDLPGLELVIHADLPTNRETLLHRSGRTGRAGRKGVSALIVPFPARRRTERLLAMAGVAAEWAAAPTAAEIIARDTERLLSDDALTAAETATEKPLITLLVERFTARELAAGVLRQYFAARSAPEDIAPVTVDGPAPRRQADFERSFWVSLGIGAAGRAEPRWLLPMLCRVGDLTRNDIGAIRIFEDRTLVQLHADCEEHFFNALGHESRLEQDISVSRADAPDPSAPPARRPERTSRPSAERTSRPSAERTSRPSAERTSRPIAERTPRPNAEHKPRPGPDRAPRSGPHIEPRSTTPAPQSAPVHADKATAPATTPRPERADRPARDTGRPPRKDAPKPAGDRRAESPRPYRKAASTEGSDRKSSPPRPAYRKGSAEGSGAPRPARQPAPTEASSPPPRPRFDPTAARNPSARLDAPAGRGKPPGGKPPRGKATGAKPGASPKGKPGGKPSGKPRRDGNSPPFRPRGT